MTIAIIKGYIGYWGTEIRVLSWSEAILWGKISQRSEAWMNVGGSWGVGRSTSQGWERLSKLIMRRHLGG